jgi:hypothetical protein
MVLLTGLMMLYQVLSIWLIGDLLFLKNFMIRSLMRNVTFLESNSRSTHPATVWNTLIKLMRLSPKLIFTTSMENATVELQLMRMKKKKQSLTFKMKVS